MARFCRPALWLSISMALVIGLRPATSVAVLASVVEPITSFSLQAPSIPFVLSGMNVETGPITAVLAPSFDSSNVFRLNFDTATSGQAIFDVTLRVQFPLLEVIDQPPPTITISETGAFVLTGNTGEEDFPFISDVQGSGAISDGSIFTGVTANSKDHIWCRDLGCRFDDFLSFSGDFGITGDALLTFPPELGGQQIDVVGSGTVTAGTPVPEPSTLALLSLGMLGLVLSGRVGVTRRARPQNI
jgi:PEP-CTERM motif